MRVLLTGSSGFVGRGILAALEGVEVVAPVRFKRREGDCLIGSMDGNTDWSDYLVGCDVVIHSAACASISSRETEQVLWETNLHATEKLAQDSVRAGVKRFIFMSSVKVNGESTSNRAPFRFDDHPNPEDSYGLSKHRAEIALKEIAEGSGMEYVILRPPVIYGPGVKSNLKSLILAVRNGLPLPIKFVKKNKRSYLALGNLVSVAILCMNHPRAANQTFLVSDGEEISTFQLVEMIANAFGVKARLIPFPVSLLKIVAKLIRKDAVIERITGDLSLNIDHTKELLDWSPPVGFSSEMLGVASYIDGEN